MKSWREVNSSFWIRANEFAATQGKFDLRRMGWEFDITNHLWYKSHNVDCVFCDRGTSAALEPFAASPAYGGLATVGRVLKRTQNSQR
ncbi:MAG TPA: hypothetical protein VFD70_04490 [Anaerolineae bacterium]|nr:hypothetical protein [Anaerolineae bacterium]